MAAQHTCLQSSFAGRVACFRPVTLRAPSSQRAALRIECKESRVGKVPVTIPPGTTYKLDDGYISVKGKNGELELNYQGELVEIKEENGRLRVYKKKETKKADETHGLVRALTQNMIIGTSEGFTKTMNMLGVGYRAATSGSQLTLNLGYSHPIVMDIPKGIKVEVDKNTTLNVSGADKSVVGQFCASIRAWRPPEPYKGKGIRYLGEFVRRKEGKRGK